MGVVECLFTCLYVHIRKGEKKVQKRKNNEGREGKQLVMIRRIFRYTGYFKDSFFTLDLGLLAGTWGPPPPVDTSSVSILLSSSPPSGVVACPPDEVLDAVEWSVAASSQLSAAAAPPPPEAEWAGLLSIGTWLPERCEG